MRLTRMFPVALLSVWLLAAAPAWAQSSLSETLHSGATATDDGTTMLVPYFSTVGVQITGTFSATLVPRVSQDALSWDTIRCTNTATGAAVSSFTAAGSYQCPTAGFRFFGAPVTAYASGTVVAKAVGTIGVSGSGGSSGGGGGTQYQEDAAHTSGDTGTMALCVRRDASTTLADTTGDYAPCQVDASGSLKVAIISGAGSGGTASNFGSATPSAGTAAGMSDGTNMQSPRVFDGDTGAGTQYVPGAILRKMASGGTVEAGTSSDPLRIDPTGTTTQPVSLASVPSHAVTNGGTFAIQESGAALTALQLIDNLVATIGSTTSGQSGALGMGAVTTAAPSYTTAQTHPLSLTASGELRVRMESTAVGSTSTDDDNALPSGTTAMSEVIARMYAYNSDSASTVYSRWSHQPLDFDSGAGTENLSVIGIGLPASGGPVIGGTSSNPFNVVFPSAQAVTQSGTWTMQPGNTANTTPWLVSLVPPTSGGTTPCYITSAASTNATNCKASAGQLYGYELINTTGTLYYLRLYNLASAPTCSSATGFIRSIPVPAATTGAGVTRSLANGEAYGTGLGFCLTAGGASTDNTNAATGVYVSLNYK